MCVLACSEQESNLVSEENTVSLISPKGIQIAENLESLKTRIKNNAVSAFGNKSFFITNINFTETDNQIAAIVEFKSVKNEFGSVLILGGLQKSTKNGRVSSTMSNGTVVDCSGGCDQQGATCRERVIFSGSNITYECTCQGTCKMTINQQ